jgi:hypothetical protein
MELLGSPIFAIIAVIIALAVESRYIYTIITRRTVPNFTGWFIIALSMSFLFFSSLTSGAWHSIWLIWVLAVLHIIEAWLALYYGVFRITRFERSLIALAFVSLVIWYVTDNPLYTILINTAIDTMGMISIAYKLFRFPETEDTIAWVVSALMYGIDMLAVTQWNTENALFITINFIECSIIAALTFRHMDRLQKIKFYLSQLFHIKL